MNDKTITALALLALLALTLTGCEDNKTPEQKQERLNDMYGSYLETVNYRGHSYIIYSGKSQGGITHDPDCSCQKGESK